MSREKPGREERARMNRAEDAKKAQDKADRARDFLGVLGGPDKLKGCCEACNYQVKTNSGEYQPCKMGHSDSGPAKEICADSSDPHYHPKKGK